MIPFLIDFDVPRKMKAKNNNNRWNAENIKNMRKKYEMEKAIWYEGS